MTGTALGIAIDRVYDLFLNYRAERLQMKMAGKYPPTGPVLVE
jgi:hypothetical protein